MRLFKLLLRKCFREILRNIKQYISIIFIIAISITLYTGLDANALGLKNRVEDVYVKGNIADEWVTLNPQFGEYEKMDETKLLVNELNRKMKKPALKIASEVNKKNGNQ